MKRIAIGACVIGVCGSLLGCGADSSTLGVWPAGVHDVAKCSPDKSCPDTVTVTFLGVGGFVIRRGNDALMTAPMFTRPSLPGIFLPGRTNESRVNLALRQFDKSGIQAILVGHSHYDHLMDVPSVMHKLTPMPQLYGSTTTKHALAPDKSLSDYQDSASDPDHSDLPRMKPSDVRQFDLVIICAGNFDKARLYPMTLLGAFRPSYAIVGHWDNFFQRLDSNPKLIPLLDGRTLRDRMDLLMHGRWAALRPMSTARFAVGSTAP